MCFLSQSWARIILTADTARLIWTLAFQHHGYVPLALTVLQISASSIVSLSSSICTAYMYHRIARLVFQLPSSVDPNFRPIQGVTFHIPSDPIPYLPVAYLLPCAFFPCLSCSRMLGTNSINAYASCTTLVMYIANGTRLRVVRLRDLNLNI